MACDDRSRGLLSALVAVSLLGCGDRARETTPDPEPSEGSDFGTGLVFAQNDEALSASIVRCEPLEYSTEAPADSERGPHVRAGSGLARLRSGSLVIAQDDMAYLAIRSPQGELRAIELPAREGHRRFEVSLGNLQLKPDLESCAALPDGRVVAFGSGTFAERAWIAVVDDEGVDWRDADALYADLRAERRFCGAELNMEGAVVVGDRLRLFQRGNGRGVDRVSAFADLSLSDFIAWLDEEGPVPPILAVQTVDLGREGTVAYGFADATTSSAGAVYFLAGAEDSETALDDGEVMGVRIGVLADGDARYTGIVGPNGEPSKLKLEGLAMDPTRPGLAWAVSDVDAPETPALLCEIRLEGPWEPATESTTSP